MRYCYIMVSAVTRLQDMAQSFPFSYACTCFPYKHLHNTTNMSIFDTCDARLHTRHRRQSKTNTMTKKIIYTAITLMYMLYSYGANGFFCRKYDFAYTDGLMQSHISNAQQDKNGFMWFATWNGLIRYDGYRFHTFKPIQCSDGTICSNRIYNIKMSGTGNIWCVSSDNRLFSFNTSTCKFCDIQKLIPAVTGKKVKVLTPLKNGTTWVTFKDFSCIRLNDSRPEGRYTYLGAGSRSLHGCKEIYAIYMDESGNEWILTDKGAINTTKDVFVGGAFRYVHSIGKYTFLVRKDGGIAVINNKGKTISRRITGGTLAVGYAVVAGSRLVMATDRGIYSMDAVTLHITCHSTKPAVYLFKDSRNRIWGFGNDNMVSMIADIKGRQVKYLTATYSPDNGLMKNPQLIMEDGERHVILKPRNGVLSYYDENRGTLEECLFYKDNATERYAPNDIKKFLVDKDRNLWVFHSGGADCISFAPSHFEHMKNLYGQETRAMAADGMGRYWITDRTNCIAISDKDMRRKVYMRRDGTTCSSHTSFSAMPIYCIKESPRRDIWVGTKGEGVYLLEPRDRKRASYNVSHLRHTQGKACSLQSDSIYDIAFISSKVYMGSYGNGLSAGTRTAGGWMFEKIKNQPQGMKVRRIVDAGNGVLLLATADGLVTADLRDCRQPRFYVNRYRSETWGLKGNDIMSIVKCGKSYYACVFGSGISRIDSKNILCNDIHFTNFAIPSSGTADQIKTAVADGNRIWMVSERGMTCFSTDTGLYHTYTGDSFTGDFNFSEAAPIIANERIVFGTSEGIVAFRSRDIEAHGSAKTVSVTGIQYQNDMTTHPLNNPTEITITPDRRSFSLYISSFEYGTRRPGRFRYRLCGYDNGWNYTQDSHPAAIYSNLPAGRHNLIIETTDSNGHWNGPGHKVEIYVVPMFTETVWFRLIMALTVAGMVAAMLFAIAYFKKMRNIIQKKYSLLMTVDKINNSTETAETEKGTMTDDDKDRKFIEESAAFFNKNIDNPRLVIEDFARHLGMSRTAYYNKMKQITGLSPVDFIKQMRIRKALKLLDEGRLSITDIAYSVGFADPKYFSRCFKAEMDMTPTQYIDSRKKKNNAT